MIETILTALTFGTLWFWLTISIASIIIIASIDNDAWGIPALTSALLAVLFWKSISIIGWQQLIVIAVGYIVIGIGWSLFKWYCKVKKITDKYLRDSGNKLTSSQLFDLKYSTSASNNKSTITGWIAWWPWSFLWSITGDAIELIYDHLKNVYQNIANKHVSKFTEIEKEIITDATRNRY